MKSQKKYILNIDSDYTIEILKGPDDNFSSQHVISSNDKSCNIEIDGVFQSAATLVLVAMSDENSDDKISLSKNILEKIKIKRYIKLKKFPFDEVLYILTGGNNVWLSEEFKSRNIEFNKDIAKKVWGDSIWELMYGVDDFYKLFIAFKEYRKQFIANGFGNYFSIVNEERNDND